MRELTVEERENMATALGLVLNPDVHLFGMAGMFDGHKVNIICATDGEGEEGSEHVDAVPLFIYIDEYVAGLLRRGDGYGPDGTPEGGSSERAGEPGSPAAG